MDKLHIKLSDAEIMKISSLGLAHLGDAVYELLVRSMLCIQGNETAAVLHRATVKYVSAPAQAAAAHKIVPMLTKEESEVYRRGRNTKVNSVPNKATINEYHAATGLEALFGWLYLRGETERLSELFAVVTEDGENAT